MLTVNKYNIFKNAKHDKMRPQPFRQYNYLNTLPLEKVDDMLLFSESDHLCGLLPDFKGKKILFLNDQRHKFVFKKILARDPDYIVNCIYGQNIETTQNLGCFSVFGDLGRFAFKPETFDCVICPFVLEGNGVTKELIQSIAGLIKNGGRLILATRHPHLEKILFNQNPSVSGVPENSMSAFFDMLKQNHLFTEEISEGCVDLSLKPFFTIDGVFDHYHEFKNIPVTLMFRAVRFER